MAVVTNVIDISGLDKAMVLSELFNHAHLPEKDIEYAVYLDGINVDHARMIIDSHDDLAELTLEEDMEFVFLYGRELRIDLGSNELDVTEYNRCNGEGLGQKVIANLRAKLAR